jgi:hypothetical protein
MTLDIHHSASADVDPLGEGETEPGEAAGKGGVIGKAHRADSVSVTSPRRTDGEAAPARKDEAAIYPGASKGRNVKRRIAEHDQTRQ